MIRSGRSSHFRTTPKTIGMRGDGGVMVNQAPVRVGGMESIGKMHPKVKNQNVTAQNLI